MTAVAMLSMGRPPHRFESTREPQLSPIGAVLLAVGTTSTPLFLFYGVLTIAGLGVFAWGRKLYNFELKG